MDAAIGLIALGGVYLAAVPFWHGVARELLATLPTASRAPGGVADPGVS